MKMDDKKRCKILQECIDRLTPAHKETKGSRIFGELHESIGALLDVLSITLEAFRDGKVDLASSLHFEADDCADDLRDALDERLFRVLRREVDYVYRRIQLVEPE